MHALADQALPPRAADKRWSDLRKRVISALVLAPIALVCIWLGGLPFAMLMLLAALGLCWEWLRLCGARVFSLQAVSLAAAVLLAAIMAALGYAPAGLLILAVGAALTAAAARGQPHWRGLVSGVPYIGVAAVALLWLRDDSATGRANLLFLLMLIWSSDIGAYLVGRLVGGAKLAPSISPGKTWSGALGGLAASVLVAGLLAPLLRGPVEFGRVAVIAVALGIVAQAGDLLESLIKRHFGVKDSSQLIPGHGGLLDRLDALLTAAPLAALLAFTAGRGVVLWQ